MFKNLKFHDVLGHVSLLTFYGFVTILAMSGVLALTKIVFADGTITSCYVITGSPGDQISTYAGFPINTYTLVGDISWRHDEILGRFVDENELYKSMNLNGCKLPILTDEVVTIAGQELITHDAGMD